MRQGFDIQWAPKSIKDMRRLPKRARELVIAKVEQYAEDPGSLANQVITLTGSEYRRMRVGSMRIIFDIKREESTVMLVLRVRNRREAYD